MISFGQLITMAKSGSRNCKKIGVFLFVLMSLVLTTHIDSITSHN